ncbi:hypothetical protein M407DRAFT_159780 [Tulasnella calospora MUT 4182]|uniref:Uncharacterized protein n=1 Tax=Tulasnella calospora MUT 4182 TaxID=1051891 RepID=A0A0C3M8J6_9AGAM|nr:hypothetical protein M407DRAFT_159780 [Tulasnella calospora MUT 4182]
MRSRAYASTLRCAMGYFSSNVSVIWEGPWRIILDVDNIRTARRVLNWLSGSPKPDSPAVPLHLMITADGDPPSVKDILAVMADTEGVHRVSFGYGTPVADALKILTTGSVVEGGAREPFPELKEIWIAELLDENEWEHLLRMLRRRQGEIEAIKGDQHLKPLRKVEFGWIWRIEDHAEEITKFRSIHWPNRIEEVRRLLGPEGELGWYRRRVTEDGVLENRRVSDHWYYIVLPPVNKYTKLLTSR